MNQIKLTSLLLITFLIITTSAAALTPSSTTNNAAVMKNYSFHQRFSTPQIQTYGSDTIITVPECSTTLSFVGAPILPKYHYRLELPFRTTIEEITGTPGNIKKTLLPSQIPASPRPVPYLSNTESYENNWKTPMIYESDAFYPPTWFTYHLTSGLNTKNQHVTILSIDIYPVTYNPQRNQIQSIDTIDFTITTQEPTTPFPLNDAYDLVIISYDRFARLLTPLVQHKTQHGIDTKLVTLRDITKGTYFPTEGRDIQEQIKYFIKNAIEQWNISYVLLVGNYKKLPVRYAQLETAKNEQYEEIEFISDLYYADIYDGAGNFSSWDTDHDENYAEWPDSFPWEMEDILDLRPDVHVGRLACLFAIEVWSTVQKIIDYETNQNNHHWFNNIVVIGGDTFHPKFEGGTNYNEGEEACNQSLAFLPDFTPIRLYTTLDNISNENMTRKISEGCGFLYFVGHGNPGLWATHYNGDYANWTDDFSNQDIHKLSHKGKYPILMVGGCHNSQFDVTPLNILLEGKDAFWYTTYPLWCWSWLFVARLNGGAIASIGSTGYGGVSVGDHNHNMIPDCVEGLDGWFETQFFRIYNQENITILGETYSKVVSDYIDTFPVYTDPYNCKIIETHVLFGDPTLKIGGYATS